MLGKNCDVLGLMKHFAGKAAIEEHWNIRQVSETGAEIKLTMLHVQDVYESERLFHWYRNADDGWDKRGR